MAMVVMEMLHPVQVLVVLDGWEQVKIVSMMAAKVVKAFRPLQVEVVAAHSAPVERAALVAAVLPFADVEAAVDTLVGPEEMGQAVAQVEAVVDPTMQEPTKATVLVSKLEREWLRSVGKRSLATSN